MKLKLDDAGAAVLADGKPVYVHDDGKELPFDAAATVATISRLNHESKTHREAKEQALASLKAFEGIEDAEAAKKALGIMKNLDAKKLVDAGEIEQVKAQAVRAYEDKLQALEAKYAPVVKERDEYLSALLAEKIGHSFASSKYIGEKLAVPSDMIQATFGHQFKVEEGKVVGYDKNGNKIFSRLKPGDIADFDESLEIIVDNYAFKDHILKGSGASGGGGPGGNRSGSNVITRAMMNEWSTNDPARAMQAMKDVSAGKAQLAD